MASVVRQVYEFAWVPQQADLSRSTKWKKLLHCKSGQWACLVPEFRFNRIIHTPILLQFCAFSRLINKAQFQVLPNELDVSDSIFFKQSKQCTQLQAC